jgi:hypothetical protein
LSSSAILPDVSPTHFRFPFSGRITVDELVDVIKNERAAIKEKKMVGRIAIVMGMLLIFTVAATVGLTAAVVYFSKDTDISGNGRMTVKGSDTAVKTSSDDYALCTGSALKTPGSKDVDPDIIGTAAVVQQLSLVEALTLMDPVYSGCPTNEFKRCFEMVVTKSLASIKTVALPGVDEYSEGLTIFQVASATLQNGTVKVGSRAVAKSVHIH